MAKRNDMTSSNNAVIKLPICLKILLINFLISFVFCSKESITAPSPQHIMPTVPKTQPPLGWNSYDCYGNGINDSLVRANLPVFRDKLKPFGYKYFVIDAGWDGVNIGINLDEYGRSIPHSYFFPNGFQDIIKLSHENGISFGLWMARGISKKAVEQNLPIKGTKYYAQDIASKTDTSNWFPYNYGVDMSKPGAQQFYNSIMDLLASWGVDFVKYDDIVPHPDEIIAVATAIRQCGRDIVLSLSPGDDFDPKNVFAYNYSSMVRVTSDIWDNEESIQKSFDKWEMCQGMSEEQFWIDLDMIPFGSLTNKRIDSFSINQKKTFITQRAIAASPLIFGGALPETDSTSFALVTNTEMLACNQNGKVGQLVFREESLDVWKTSNKTQLNSGWFGVFNRSNSPQTISLQKDQLNLDTNLTYNFYDIWGNDNIPDIGYLDLNIPSDGTVFIKYFPTK